jgi:hypothetical protein
MTNGSPTTATVETLTAEVRVLQVGNRQVTLSMYKQLDRVSPWHIEPFGRVQPGTRYQTGYDGFKEPAYLELVGRDEHGALVACVIMDRYSVPGFKSPRHDDSEGFRARFAQWKTRWDQRLAEFEALPLIVLAGLR